DELEVSADGATAGRPGRVKYRVRGAGAARTQAMLAAPQLVDDERVRQPLEDLTFTLVLAILVGLVAAVALAGLVARGLARPVAALRDAAVALGQSAPLPTFPPGALREFQPVVSAFERMAADVHKSQAALEVARHRTAQVLANVATGVIAVDEGLRVTMANPRAADLLGTPLEPGNLLPRTASSEWLPVWNAVSEFLAAGTGAGGAGGRGPPTGRGARKGGNGRARQGGGVARNEGHPPRGGPAGDTARARKLAPPAGVARVAPRVERGGRVPRRRDRGRGGGGGGGRGRAHRGARVGRGGATDPGADCVARAFA